MKTSKKTLNHQTPNLKIKTLQTGQIHPINKTLKMFSIYKNIRMYTK